MVPTGNNRSAFVQLGWWSVVFKPPEGFRDLMKLCVRTPNFLRNIWKPKLRSESHSAHAYATNLKSLRIY